MMRAVTYYPHPGLEPGIQCRDDGQTNREGLDVSVRVGGNKIIPDRTAMESLKSFLEGTRTDWLFLSRPNWFFDVAKFKASLPAGYKKHIEDLDWLDGVVQVVPEVETSSQLRELGTYVHFRILKEEFLLDNATKVFLSHKGADKPRVRQFFSVLKELGYAPWLDEDAMPAGSELHRGILQGFKDSCAAVFFITPNFRDEAYLRSEVNHAMKQKTEKRDRFAIITLVFKDEAGKKGNVPELLHNYVWKEPATDLVALTEIVRAMPITLGLPSWLPGI